VRFAEGGLSSQSLSDEEAQTPTFFLLMLQIGNRSCRLLRSRELEQEDIEIGKLGVAPFRGDRSRAQKEIADWPSKTSVNSRADHSKASANLAKTEPTLSHLQKIDEGDTSLRQGSRSTSS
jgi:hypothetical protein